MKKSITSKIIAFAAAAAMIMSMGAAAFGASYIGENTAISKALKNAGTTRSAVWDLECEKDKDDGVTVYEVEFKKGSTEYSYKINAKTGAVREKSVEYGYRYLSGKLIGQTAAIDKAFAFSGISKASVTNLVCRYDYDDGKAVYEVKFRKGSWKYEYDVNARTGKIVEYSREYSPKKSTVNTNDKYIGKDKALEIALAKAGLVKSQITLEKVKLDTDDGVKVYDVEFYVGNVEYDFEIDAVKGTVLKFEKDGNPDDFSKYIGEAKAKEIALAKAGLAASQIYGFEIELDDGVYEIEFKYNGMEYSMDINAVTGTITDFEAEDDFSKYIGEAKAKEIALAKAGLAASQIYGFEIELEDGEYEIEFKYNGMEYSMDINAVTGTITDFETEYDD